MVSFFKYLHLCQGTSLPSVSVAGCEGCGSVGVRAVTGMPPAVLSSQPCPAACRSGRNGEEMWKCTHTQFRTNAFLFLNQTGFWNKIIIFCNIGGVCHSFWSVSEECILENYTFTFQILTRTRKELSVYSLLCFLVLVIRFIPLRCINLFLFYIYLKREFKTVTLLVVVLLELLPCLGF